MKRQRVRHGLRAVKPCLVLAAASICPCHEAFMVPSPPGKDLSSLSAVAAMSPPVKSASTPVADPIPQLNTFDTWLTRQGVLHPAIELGESDVDGRGLYAARPIRKDELLFVVPEELILRPKLPIGLEGVEAQTMLALRLLLEKHRGNYSPFCGYIRSLPAPEDMHMPLMWSEEDLKLLDNPGGELFRWRRSVVQEGQDIMQIVSSHAKAFEGLTFTTDEWLWARALAISRPYLLDSDDEWSLAIVPLVDFTNHRDDAQCAIRSLEDGSVAFVSDRSYSPHEQIWTSYGGVGAAHKFFTFGFLNELLTEGGKSTGVPGQGSCFVTFPLAEDNHARDLKYRVVKAVGLNQPAEFEFRVFTEWAETDRRTAVVQLENDKEICRLMAYLRMAMAGPDEIDPDEETPLAEIWARFDTGPPSREDRVAIAMVLDTCREIMRTAAERLVYCQNDMSGLDVAVKEKTRKGWAAKKQGKQHDMQPSRKQRFKLASLWLQGELLAVQALMEYMLDAVGAHDTPLLSYD